MARNVKDGLVPVLDAHCDSVIQRLVRGDPTDLAVEDPDSHVDLPRLRKGGVAGAFVMVGGYELGQSSLLMAAVHEMAERRPEEFALCLTQRDLRAAFASGRFALVPTLESLTFLGQDARHLRNWRKLGAVLTTLTHGEGLTGRPGALQVDPSFFGFISSQDRAALLRQSKGLTPFGAESLKLLEELDMALDLAHANDRTFWQVLERFEGRMCYTHGACYALAGHARNLTDEMMKALAERGGVMGICFHRDFVDEKAPSLARLADHFLHALEIMGEDGVGVGTDFDGLALHKPPVIEDAAGVDKLWEELTRRGVSRATQEKIGWKNFLRMMPKG